MRNLSPLLIAPLAAACATVAPPAEAAPASACSSESLARYIGLASNGSLAARMKRETGKTNLRWVRPGVMVTMDMRGDRLTVYLDAVGKVERASCM